MIYLDGRPTAPHRMGAADFGVVLKHGDGPDGCDVHCVREAVIHRWGDKFALFYDGAGENSWVVCLAVSNDLIHWDKKGPLLSLGEPGDKDAAAAISPWVFYENDVYHMFYIAAQFCGTEGAAKGVPAFPYLTMKATAPDIVGPYEKQPGLIPFDIVPGTYYSITASAGDIMKQDGEYMMFFSCTSPNPLTENAVHRTVSIARTRDLNGIWTIDDAPAFAIDQQIENTSLYYEPENGYWFMFTNHIGTDTRTDDQTDGAADIALEYTDAIWVYWSKDPNHWDMDNKAVVLDGSNCTWSSRCIGMPTVLPVENRLAIFYDSPGGDSIDHLHRDIGLCFLDLPLQPI